MGGIRGVANHARDALVWVARLVPDALGVIAWILAAALAVDPPTQETKAHWYPVLGIIGGALLLAFVIRAGIERQERRQAATRGDEHSAGLRRINEARRSDLRLASDRQVAALNRLASKYLIEKGYAEAKALGEALGDGDPYLAALHMLSLDSEILGQFHRENVIEVSSILSALQREFRIADNGEIMTLLEKRNQTAHDLYQIALRLDYLCRLLDQSDER